MSIRVRSRVKFVIGPDGSPLTLADLPAANTTRWVIRRKAQVVAAVRGGLLTLEEACERYRLTMDEYLSWQQSIDRHGLAGLRTTKVQEYRDPPSHGAAEPVQDQDQDQEQEQDRPITSNPF